MNLFLSLCHCTVYMLQGQCNEYYAQCHQYEVDVPHNYIQMCTVVNQKHIYNYQNNTQTACRYTESHSVAMMVLGLFDQYWFQCVCVISNIYKYRGITESLYGAFNHIMSCLAYLLMCSYRLSSVGGSFFGGVASPAFLALSS